MEAFTGIANDEVNLTGVFPQLHFHPFFSAVLYGVGYGLLKNSKERKADVERQIAGKIASERDLHFVPTSDLLAPALHARNGAQIFQVGGVQIVRYSLHIFRDLPQFFSELL